MVSSSAAKSTENHRVLRFSAVMIEWWSPEIMSAVPPTAALGLGFCLVMTRKPRTRTIRGQAMTVSFESLKHDRMSFFFVGKSVDLPLWRKTVCWSLLRWLFPSFPRLIVSSCAFIVSWIFLCCWQLAIFNFAWLLFGLMTKTIVTSYIFSLVDFLHWEDNYYMNF